MTTNIENENVGHEVAVTVEDGWHVARCTCGWSTWTARAWSTLRRADRHVAGA